MTATKPSALHQELAPRGSLGLGCPWRSAIMEDEESGGSACNSSDGDRQSRSPSPLYEPTQLVSSGREGGYGRMEPTQLLSNDFYAREMSRQGAEESDEEFEDEEEDDEEDDNGGQHPEQEDGSQSDDEGAYKETQLLQQYNAAHYGKADYGGKTRLGGVLSAAGFGEEDTSAETQLLEPYSSGGYEKAEYGKAKPMPPPLDLRSGNARGVGSWQHEKVDSDAETADSDELMETVDSEGTTEDEGDAVPVLRQDQREMLYREKPRSEFARDRTCEFDMDLNVSLEEEMDCEYYEEPRNCDTQLVASGGETRLGCYGDTQLVTTSDAGYHVDVNFGTHVVEPQPPLGGCDNGDSNPSLTAAERNDAPPIATGKKDFFELMRNSEVQVARKIAEAELPHVASPSFTMGSAPPEKPSVSGAPESTLFQSVIGSVRADSMRTAAMRPMTWHPKLDPENLVASDPKGLWSPEKQRDPVKTMVGSGGRDLPWQQATEPEWMRKYNEIGKVKEAGNRGSAGNIFAELGTTILDRRAGPAGSSSALYVPPLWLGRKDKTANGTGGQEKVGEKGVNSVISGIKPPFASYNLSTMAGYVGLAAAGKPAAGENAGSEKRTALQQRSSFGTAGLSSPTGSLNYLDSSEPGEEVQAQALDMVDKLVWLNTSELPQDSPPKKPRKIFSGLAPAPAVPATDPALRVYEFEDTPLQADLAQKYSDVSLIKEIQAGWKKRADQGHLFAGLKKGKEAAAVEVLPEGERLSKLLTEESREIVFEPRLPLNVSSGKRVSTRSQDKGKQGLESMAATKSRVADAISAEELGTMDEKAAEPDVGITENGGGAVKQGTELGAETAGQNVGQEVEGEERGSVAAHILTRRRTQGRNRREHVRAPDALFLSERSPSLDRRLGSSGGEAEKSPSTARKRKSLNIMLRDQLTRKARRRGGEDAEEYGDQVHEDLDTLASALNSGVKGNSLTGEWKRATSAAEKEEEEAVPPPTGALEKGRKRIKLSEASIARLLGSDDEADEQQPPPQPAEDRVKTRSLRYLPRRSNGNIASAEPFVGGLVRKGLRSVRRGHGGPATTIRGNDGEQDEAEKETSSGTSSSATSEGDQDDGAREADDASSPADGGDEPLKQKTSEILVPSAEEAGEDAGAGVTRGRTTKRTRSIADVSSPTTPTPVLQPIPFPLVTGRRGRGAVMKPEAAEEAPLQCPAASAPGKGLRMRTVRKRKDPLALAFASGIFPELSREESGSGSGEATAWGQQGPSVRVLFSHGLSEDTVTKQRKILEKLDGKVATKAAECTHFVAEKFVRTGNMLEAMAAGKFVVTFAWLESCEIANCFIDERSFVLEDERKERDMGFSMCATLVAAQRRPLLQGVRVLLTPNINPKPQAIAAIVHAAGGQVVDVYEGPPPDVSTEDFCMVISNEDDYSFCVPLLEQGAKVYKSELILSGIVAYHLDFAKHALFDGYRTGRRRWGPVRPT